ncbi:MAG: Maf family protein [Thermogutta sp.]
MAVPAKPKIILASRSPRRQHLLQEAGYSFEVVPPAEGAECGFCSGESPPQYAARLAYQKAADVARRIQTGLILACDTVVSCNGRIVGKPRDENDARSILYFLRGKEHSVFTAVCLWDYPRCAPNIQVAETKLVMENLSDAEIEEYISSRLWEGKAGAFGYQDRLGWLRILEGSESNVVGLPIELLERMLQQKGPPAHAKTPEE